MNQIPETLNKVLNDLAARFGSTGAALWTSYVHYTQACAAAELFGWLLIGLTIGIYCTRWQPSSQMISESDGGVYAVKYAGMIIGLVITSLSIGTCLPQIIAPQGAALTAILAGFHN